jgi:hypothetical protein
LAVAGEVAAVAEFSQANDDLGHRSQDLLDGITTVRAGSRDGCGSGRLR